MLITVNIDLNSEAAQTRLLEGLETWLRLGLLSDAQVKQLCETHLNAPLPPAPVTAVAESSGGAWIMASPSSPPSSPSPQPPRAERQPPSLASRVLQSFVAEISVIWLLFLGVFMVIVSSGVLAATQWRNFPPSGQYTILLAYTLAFWGASLWTSRQPQLQLTARMLTIATLLLIPVNFWMMDGLGVGQSTLGLGLMAIAALVLTTLTLRLLQTTVGLPPAVNPRLTAVNAIGLGWLHWGWGQWPLIATYFGTVGTAFCLSYQLQQRDRHPSISTDQPQAPFPELFSLGTIAIAFSTLLLLGRAIFGAQIPLSRLGLALGICGWLLCWLSRPIAHRELWSRVGTALLLAGWAVTVLVQPPWQAIAVSGLGLWLLWDRLKAAWQLTTLATLLGVGFQTFWLLWFVLPESWRQGVIDLASDLAGYPVDGAYLGSIGGFPYVVLMLGLARWLQRQNQSRLAKDTELLALALGGLLTALGLPVGLMRSLNLLLSAITLGVVVRHRAAAGRAITPGVAVHYQASAGHGLIYLTHTTALAALLSWIDHVNPGLAPLSWVKVLLGLVVVEWTLSVGDRYLKWRQSAWHLGLLLAGLAYPILFVSQPNGYWRSLWLIVPIGLTLLGHRRRFSQADLANWLTILALGMQLLLVNSLDSLLITLGVATILMLVNTQRLQQLIAAGLTVGFALGLAATAIWRGFSEQLTDTLVLNLVAIAVWSLWLLRFGLSHRNSRLARLYKQATDGWAIGLTVLLLLVLTVYSVGFYVSPLVPSWSFLGAAILTTLAIAYRLWQQPSDLGFCALAWGLEIGVAGAVALAKPDVVWVAIATLALGLLAQVLGDWWITQTSQPYQSSWHVIPLTYGALGWVLAHENFTAASGLYTLATALIWIGVGRRQPSLQPLTYLSLAAVSIGAYELLVYQLLQSTEGELGDGITLLAGLAALIAFAYRLLVQWLLSYLRLSTSSLYTIAHLHWALGSSLALVAIASSLSPPGANLWLSVMLLLTIYALLTANHYLTPLISSNIDAMNRASTQHPTQHPFLYAGILEAIATLTYALHRLLPEAVLLSWGGAIACGLAIPMYYLPWETWGWPLRPWRRSACILPGAAVILTSGGIALQTLLITGAFYAWLAKATRQVRLSYISVFLLDWAILRYLTTQGWLEPIWISTVIGCSVLYLIQLEPELQNASDRDKRHLLRMLATGLICLTALYQAEVEAQPAAIWFAILTLALSIGLIFSGLVLQTRAFLYVGTATFIVRVLRLLWLFISNYSLLLWAIGIVIGLIFIWVAATFEARRSQVNAFVQYWATELEAWE
jgi:hypothetical protein